MPSQSPATAHGFWPDLPAGDIAGWSDAGLVRAFFRAGTSWTERPVVVGGASTAEGFGREVAVSSDGTRIIVGVPTGATAAGSAAGWARIFSWDASGSRWVDEATLTAGDGAAGDELGYAVALDSDGTRAIVGAWQDDTAGIDWTGSARVFVRTGTTWAEEATLVQSSPATWDRAGQSVALSADGSRAMVGVVYDDTADGGDAGSVRIFVRSGSTWSEDATLVGPGASSSDQFGASVSFAADGRRAIVGVPYDATTAGSSAGSAHVFSRGPTGWSLEATLLRPGARAFERFGGAVALSADGTRALVGAEAADTASGPRTGAASVFVRTGTTWSAESELVAAAPSTGDALGASVALSADGTRAIAGATYDDTAAGSTGSVSVFVRSGSRWAAEVRPILA